MGAFDYGAEAALFFAKGSKFRHKFRHQAVEYQLFVRVAEAIRFAIEDLPSNTSP
jgi:hypothetical protein